MGLQRVRHDLTTKQPPPAFLPEILLLWFQIQKLGSCITDPGTRETSGNTVHTVFHRDKTKDAHPESCCSSEKGGQPLPWFEHRKNVPQFAEPTETSFGPDSGKGAKSLVELLVSKP